MVQAMAAVDWGSGKGDMIAFAMKCSSCGKIIHSKVEIPGRDAIEIPIYHECPHCRKKLKQIYIRAEENHNRT